MMVAKIISLLSESESPEDANEIDEHPPQFQPPRQQSMFSPTYRSCSWRAFTYLMSLDLHQFSRFYLQPGEIALFQAIQECGNAFSVVHKYLGVLFGRKWPKWKMLRVDDPDDLIAIDALVSMGCVYTLESISDWPSQIVTSPDLSPCGPLSDMPVDTTSQSCLDLLLHSLSPKLLASLSGTNKQPLSKSKTIQKLKSAFDGKQRTIFGDVNDTAKLVKTVAMKLESDNLIALLLSPMARRVFTIISFVLDIDSENEDSWNMALPGTLLKTFANVTTSPRLWTHETWTFDNIPSHLRIYRSRDEVENQRVICYLEDRVINKKIDPVVVAEKVRESISRLPPGEHKGCNPEWWIRRQIPRRLSNLMWKCIAEIERLKQYDIAVSHLSFLLDNHTELLGKKRLGKVLVRFMICSGHVSEDETKVRSRVAKFLSEPCLYPADVAELTRRLAGMSPNKFEWPCGDVCQREVVIPGAKSREVNWVEQAAIEHYYVSSEGGYENGVHCEGRVMMIIFSTLFKDSVLSPGCVSFESGLIQTPLQKWAMDIGFLEECSKERWNNALGVIDRFATLDYENLANFYSNLITEAHAKETRAEEMPVLDILGCMRGSVLAAIMRLMIADPYYWGGGQPDLIVWNASRKEVCFSEVKGPGDQLSPRQRWWLAHLRDAGATAEVCWVIDEPKEPKKISRRKQEPAETSKNLKRRKRIPEFPNDPESGVTGSSTNSSTVEIIELTISSQD